MANLKIDDNLARKLYPTALPEFKAVLDSSYPAGYFSQNPMDFITSFEAACEYNNMNPKDRKFTEGTDSGIAMEQIAEICKALNGGKVMTSIEKRYYPYFEYHSSGFRFYAAAYVITGADANSGPRLCVRTPELAKYLGTKFLPYYDRFLNPAQ